MARAFPTRLLFMVRVLLIAYLDVLERRIRLHLVVLGLLLLDGHGDLLGSLLLRLLDTVIVHVDA